MSYKNKVKASSFLAWYFIDSMDERDIAYRVITELKAFGRVTISAGSLFDGCGYIPQYICEVDGDAEYDPSEVLFIDDLGKEVSNG
jgi:hypothetical protein